MRALIQNEVRPFAVTGSGQHKEILFDTTGVFPAGFVVHAGAADRDIVGSVQCAAAACTTR
jgi:hypothetical protein